jgi:hypothetical protein
MMNCQEARQKLSEHADKALSSDEHRAVDSHLAECPACRRELDEQGALDMLLKSRFAFDPPEDALESIWPSVSERIDGPGDKPSNGGGTAPDEGEIVFKSSSAMGLLNIPERPITPAPRLGSPVITQAPEGSPWRWPVALVFSMAFLVAGFLIYKKMTAPPPSTEPVAAAGRNEAKIEGPASAPASQPVAVALNTPSEAGAEPKAEPSSPTEAKARPAIAAKRAKARKSGGKADTEPKSEAKAEPKVKADPKPAAKGKKSDDLDNLIDTAIGPEAKAASKKKEKAEKTAPAPGSDLPEQLTMNQIQTGMQKIKGLVGACYDQYQVEGLAKVSFTISPEGTVKDATVKGKFFGTDTGTCVVNAVKKARFPKFSGKAIPIPNYPFQLQ